MRDVYLIAGPPCSGKTTFARELATDHEIVDYDEIAGGHREFSAAVEAEVQSRIHRIATDPHARAVVIRSVPEGQKRQALVELLDARCYLINPGKAECLRRAVSRPSGTRKAIGLWYWKYTPSDCDEI